MNESAHNKKIEGGQEGVEIQNEKIESDGIYNIERRIDRITGKVLEIFVRDQGGRLIEYDNI